MKRREHQVGGINHVGLRAFARRASASLNGRARLKSAFVHSGLSGSAAMPRMIAMFSASVGRTKGRRGDLGGRVAGFFMMLPMRFRKTQP
jgi:hypothetical protein